MVQTWPMIGQYHGQMMQNKTIVFLQPRANFRLGSLQGETHDLASERMSLVA